MTPKEKKAFVARMKKGKKDKKTATRATSKKTTRMIGKQFQKLKKQMRKTSGTKVSLSAKVYSTKYRREHIERTRKNFAYVDYDKGKYYVHTFRKNAKPQWYKHAPMTKQEAVKYAAGFNFQNRER